jgi:hypothetical protein
MLAQDYVTIKLLAYRDLHFPGILSQNLNCRRQVNTSSFRSEV